MTKLAWADYPRSLGQEYRCFNPNGLKYRYYYFDWDRGHRYILNALFVSTTNGLT